MPKPLRLLLASGFIWLVPFIISLGFYDQNGVLVAPFLTFKISIILASTLAALVALYWYYRMKDLNDWWVFAIAAIVVNIILDMIFLIGFLKLDFGFWISSVLPVYLIMIPTTSWVIKKLVYKSQAIKTKTGQM